MSIDEKAQEATQMIHALLAELATIVPRAHQEQDYDTAFEKLDRWKSRTVRLLRDHVSLHEGDKFEQKIWVRDLLNDLFETLDDEANEYRAFSGLSGGRITKASRRFADCDS